MDSLGHGKSLLKLDKMDGGTPMTQETSIFPYSLTKGYQDCIRKSWCIMLNHVFPSEKNKQDARFPNILTRIIQNANIQKGRDPPHVTDLGVATWTSGRAALHLCSRDSPAPLRFFAQLVNIAPILLGSTNDIHDKPSKNHDTSIIIPSGKLT